MWAEVSSSPAIPLSEFLSGAPLWTETPKAPVHRIVWDQARGHETVSTLAETPKSVEEYEAKYKKQVYQSPKTRLTNPHILRYLVT